LAVNVYDYFRDKEPFRFVIELDDQFKILKMD